jgi:hypothetical protein
MRDTFFHDGGFDSGMSEASQRFQRPLANHLSFGGSCEKARGCEGRPFFLDEKSKVPLKLRFKIGHPTRIADAAYRLRGKCEDAMGRAAGDSCGCPVSNYEGLAFGLHTTNQPLRENVLNIARRLTAKEAISHARNIPVATNNITKSRPDLRHGEKDSPEF